MSKQKVVILGCTGMLGSITLDWLSNNTDFELAATHRPGSDTSAFTDKYKNVEFRELDAEKAGLSEINSVVKDADWVINAIGIIKPYIHDDNPSEVERATRVNALFPHLLGQAIQNSKTKVIQIATDCVYSGLKGSYVESDAHDALDVYGKSKSLGEAYIENMHHIRCSIIGPELKAHLSLLDWFLGQDKNTKLNGYTNHQWNGVTTLQFARLCQGIISLDESLPHVQHIIPGNLITKSDLLKAFAKAFNRSDISVEPVEAPTVVDRTLSTINQELNDKIWAAAGYDSPPTIEQMVEELAQYSFKVEKI